MRRSDLVARVALTVLAGVIGCAMSMVLTFTHRQYVVELAGISVPFGLIGGLAIVAAYVAGVRLAFGERIPALAAGAGAVVAVGLLGIPMASGSTPYVGDAVDYVWIVGPTVIAIVVVGWPDRKRRVRAA